jgi:hypothetical protein
LFSLITLGERNHFTRLEPLPGTLTEAYPHRLGVFGQP